MSVSISEVSHTPQFVDTVFGCTPLVDLRRITNGSALIQAKLEYFNPSGSIKDRIVAFIINDAERRGVLKPGGTLVEHTSGNTGAAVAMIAAARGYRAVLTMPDKVSQEKQAALRAYGAEIIVCPTQVPPGSANHYVERAKAIAAERHDAFLLGQYDNLKNREAHYSTTGPEIWAQTGGQIDYFIASGSTGGTVSGVGRYLKEKNPAIQVIMPDPVGSIYAHYFSSKKIDSNLAHAYQVEGIGEDHITGCMDFDVIDEVLTVSDEQAFLAARNLARREGILGGGSTGANIWGCLEIAKRLGDAGKGKRIVTIVPDSGLKYLSKFYDDNWMKSSEYTKSK
ncbi:PLP-dependent cysteine synthase family protein [Photorhabdus heterorhabditis]|uniref:PLP-dependent cysteine synthase family protein n=1 Tax=Photorhabdus heterorhabditis TaxID=880156 RepID=UPI001561AFD4|nr:cysteine synthase family protein [Photorhabdus heterorhabditis]NRN27196.1 cysteine synthase family protein [Photorhabdus heterorhabditis subsp. aluminescens]